MSTYTVSDPRKVTTKRIADMRLAGEKIAMITAYDFTMATLVDQAGIDIILVGDSASNVMQGNATTIPITIDDMIVYGRTVVRAVKRAMVIVDMPFGTYQGDPMEAQRNAVRIMQETGADGVKLEGGREMRAAIEMILRAGIPVMGHLGLTPQSINKFGTYSTRAQAGRNRLLRHRTGEDSRHTGRQGHPVHQRAHHRHWWRWRLQRTGACATRYARPEPRVQAQVPARL